LLKNCETGVIPPQTKSAQSAAIYPDNPRAVIFREPLYTEFGVFMSAAPSLSSLPQWPDFAGVAGDSLSSLSQLSFPVQWLLAESHDNQRTRILLCSGEGPLQAGDLLPPCDAPSQTLKGGTLFTAVLAQQSDHASYPQGFVGIWLPDSHTDAHAVLSLLNAKAGLFGALLSQLHRSEALLAELTQARVDADTDPLTGLLNRRGWSRQLAREEARCQRYGNSCTLIVIDLDELKKINDKQGHCAGDKIIRQTALLLSETIRQPDVVARLGGDEFAVLLANTDALSARGFEQRLARALASNGIRASTGKASWQPGERLHDTLCRADQAMYANKLSQPSPIYDDLPAEGL
jgi:diguanylate cyclase (GGDEF)-like protein